MLTNHDFIFFHFFILFLMEIIGWFLRTSQTKNMLLTLVHMHVTFWLPGGYARKMNTNV
jgi:hypothetical protein